MSIGPDSDTLPLAAHVTRRQVLQAIGLAGGAAGAYGALHALGLIPQPLKTDGDPGGTAPPRGDGRVVIILGAGLAGMAAAYELGKAGYRCQILEARARAGGRCWTVRRGTVETELGGERQECMFDEGQYMNPGPARIPHHHRAILGYCKEFGVPLEVFVNSNNAAYYYHEERQGATGALVGRKMRQR
jgi:monoamine oxidase